MLRIKLCFKMAETIINLNSLENKHHVMLNTFPLNGKSSPPALLFWSFFFFKKKKKKKDFQLTGIFFFFIFVFLIDNFSLAGDLAAQKEYEVKIFKPLLDKRRRKIQEASMKYKDRSLQDPQGGSKVPSREYENPSTFKGTTLEDNLDAVLFHWNFRGMSIKHIRRYYGERIAMYCDFQRLYNKFMIPISLLSIPCYIINLLLGQGDDLFRVSEILSPGERLSRLKFYQIFQPSPCRRNLLSSVLA